LSSRPISLLQLISTAETMFFADLAITKGFIVSALKEQKPMCAEAHLAQPQGRHAPLAPIRRHYNVIAGLT
jgi:hypothetical protein